VPDRRPLTRAGRAAGGWLAGTRRARVAAAVARELTAARTAARGALAAAEHDGRTAQAALAAARPRLAAQRASRTRALHQEVDRRTAAATADLLALAARAAPGAAGTGWESWQPTPPERGAPAALLRIGTVAGHAPVPALVPLLDAVHVAVTGGDRTRADGVVATLLLRAVGASPAGSVALYVHDPEHLGAALAGFAPLAGSAPPATGGLPALLDDLVEHVRRIHHRVLAGAYPSLAALAAATGRRPEPWRILVLLGDEELPAGAAAQLDRLLRTGVAAGVHVLARGRDLPGAVAVRLGPPVRSDLTGPVDIVLDPPPPAALVHATCRDLAAGPPPARFADLLPDRYWTHSSAAGLRAPVGEGTDGRPVELVLGDNPPHALIGGASGSGKTNLVYAWLAALTSRYSPAELELYLLDFKEGVSFTRFAPGTRDPSWLPHVRLAGVNVNNDREFGLALLRYLGGELRRRSAAARRLEVTKLAELRAEDPGGHWPRIVAVVDEFQVLLDGRDAITAEAVTLLEDLARRGRSAGIHLVLASQDVAGIEALWGRPGLVGQFTLRVALPRARRILADGNLAAESIPRYHAVVNADAGAPGADQVVRLPDAGTRADWQELQQRLWLMRDPQAPPPRLFDGDAVPVPPAVPAAGTDGTGAPADAVLGELIDVTGRPALLRLHRAPGRNLAVLGTRAEPAGAILASAARSLRAAWPAARFSVLCPEPELLRPAWGLADAVGADWYGAEDLAGFLATTAAGVLAGTAAGVDPPGTPHVLLGYALDAAGPALAARPAGGGPTGLDHLRTVLHRGPERRVHTLGWWRGVARLREDLGGPGARLDPIGAWVALDVHGAELAPLSNTPGGPAWYPRPGRALFFDRSVHRVPEVLIPYRMPEPPC